jgi:hypothetical protein
MILLRSPVHVVRDHRGENARTELGHTPRTRIFRIVFVRPFRCVHTNNINTYTYLYTYTKMRVCVCVVHARIRRDAGLRWDFAPPNVATRLGINKLCSATAAVALHTRSTQCTHINIHVCVCVCVIIIIYIHIYIYIYILPPALCIVVIVAVDFFRWAAENEEFAKRTSMDLEAGRTQCKAAKENWVYPTLLEIRVLTVQSSRVLLKS